VNGGGAVAVTAFEKLYYRIGEVAEILEINTSVLRFWETQFEQLKPQKTKTGQRLYSQRELELAKQIQKLLYNEKLTIAGARARICTSRRGKTVEKVDMPTFLDSLKQELQELRKILD